MSEFMELPGRARAWIVAGIYVVKAAGWDKSAAAVLAKFKK